MTRDDIIRMAREAGFCHDINNGIYLCAPMHIERFAALVAAAEREAYAKIVDEFCYGNTKILVEKAIRARGKK